MMQLSHAQNTPPDFLNAHNTARSQENYAKQRISTCTLVHSDGHYGENLAGSTGSMTGTTPVNLWGAEKPNYNYNTNTCAAGKVCGGGAKVVLRNSVSLGCASVTCNNGGTFVICNYNPPGNYVGQLPY
ncbi:hypothetical protein GIB67_017014 [Kingdonia uniflora]|uniref:SCP domain-containing protein n=1 Tax=Kingdonia uniflora TaxID=39325 RepID=A0A7J7LRM7_9MAGN|nr:hypothetical protein GIB67_017014 [Kingdonia uniflora]